MSEYCKNCFELAEKLAKKEQECEALKSERFTRESLITLQEDELQLGEQLINGILKTLNLEAYDWCADQNEIITEIKTFEEKYEALKLENQEGYEIVAELKQECEALKSKIYDLRQLRELDREARVRFYNQGCEYREALEEIELTIKNLEKGDILTFPDFTLQENATMIINQCNQGYRDILDIINKALRNDKH